ncbi:D-alanine--D-alanine ligase [Candidatus Xenohaliotis californiensis]|uniref:D-alanine--D-alanine ligase n=1 Tax=Candidatus Xenohaliotis californiensis TaxID=84677 RepID=A0ABP0ETC2_9RICK|nr:D-alanine--D-alanine ligase [Candidatus Xenohaliotis californiensis]
MLYVFYASIILCFFTGLVLMLCVVLLKGGDSPERFVSLTSAEMVEKSLLNLGYKTFSLDIRDNFFLELAKITPKPDILFLATHGGMGENGCLQGLCEFLNIPYTHSGVMSSAICMHKPTTKAICSMAGIPTPFGCVVNSLGVGCCDDIPPPHVVKPVFGGSSLDVMLVDHIRNINNFPKGDFLVEEYIHGRELTAGVLGDQYLGPLEIVLPDSKFFDYDAKYKNSSTQYVKPNLPQDVLDRLHLYTIKAHNACGCEVLSRVDFRYNTQKNKLFLLEINTNPGLSKRSLIPIMAANAGICFDDLIAKIITLSLAKKPINSNVVASG